MNNSDWYVYIVKCKDGSLYTGISLNIKRRIKQHNSGNGAKSIVKSKRPVKLIYSEKHNSQGNALRREKEIKGWRREKKVDLVRSINK